jgi:squalene-hopene/tetraprenyl-beta-curcumene cyclase
MPAVKPSRLRDTLGIARQSLLDARASAGHWAGELSSSALSTATAVTALALVRRECRSEMHVPMRLLTRGLDWLAEHQNPDGGWGDTVRSVSNISTTALCWAAFAVLPGEEARHSEAVHRAKSWLAQHSGGVSLDVERLTAAIIARYGKDRTFSVPILTMCALAGRLDDGAKAWRDVIPLPFELAAAPHQLFAALRLPVVSYALPALIAIGQARHHHLPPRNPLTRWLRDKCVERTLRKLADIQPSRGGFLEATPLTSFVTMSLAGSGRANHPVSRKGVAFLVASARPDGSWPIDTNLATWVTTLSVNALAEGGELVLNQAEREHIASWLLTQQYRVEHPYTHAAPGGWAWTDLPGGVPDADDTAGALLALHHLRACDQRTLAAVELGVKWLLDLQNSDGGIPTFCRGWTNLPFDRSSPDLTAHALRAWAAWSTPLSPSLAARMTRAMDRAVDYLQRTQRADGSWLPLWFGNQHAHDDENPTYGTARVLRGLESLDVSGFPGIAELRERGAQWLASIQNEDGSWSGLRGGPASVEETALSIEALAAFPAHSPAVKRGLDWLVARVEDGSWTQPSPIGFYFAKLWYFERLYPLIFTVGALERVVSSRPR